MRSQVGLSSTPSCPTGRLPLPHHRAYASTGATAAVSRVLLPATFKKLLIVSGPYAKAGVYTGG